MDKKQQHEQKQEQPKRPWHAPQLERLQVSLDTNDGTRGSGVDFGVEPENPFGGG